MEARLTEKDELIYFGPKERLPLEFDQIDALHGDEQQLHFLHGAREVILKACETGLIEEKTERDYPLSNLLDEIDASLKNAPATPENEEFQAVLDCIFYLSDVPAVRRLHRSQGIDVTFVQSEHRDFGYPEFSCIEWNPLQTATLNAL